LNIYDKQIKTVHEVERHNEIRIIIPNQYMTSLLKIQSKSRICWFLKSLLKLNKFIVKCIDTAVCMCVLVYIVICYKYVFSSS